MHYIRSGISLFCNYYGRAIQARGVSARTATVLRLLRLDIGLNSMTGAGSSESYAWAVAGAGHAWSQWTHSCKQSRRAREGTPVVLRDSVEG